MWVLCKFGPCTSGNVFRYRLQLLSHDKNIISRVWRFLLSARREFSVEGEYHYNRSSPLRWIVSHFLRYKHLAFGYILLSILTNSTFSLISIQAGNAFNVV